MPGDTVSVIRPRTYEEAAAAVRDCGARGTVARGSGRAHGDAARNAGGAVLDMAGLDRIHVVDAAEGLVLCDAGVFLHRLAEVLLPLGWFVPVAPGPRPVTVGGAIGADLHGPNQHVSGSFSRHVLSLEMLTADGEVRTVRPGTPLFEATAGGMGLTGVILTATIRLLPVQTSYLTVDTERAPSLDVLMDRLAAADHRYRYSAARVDLTARGAATGRGVLVRGDHTPLDAPGASPWRRLSAALPRTPLPAAPAARLGRIAAGLVDGLWFHTVPRARTGELRRLSASLRPLHALPQGGRSVVPYRFVVGHGQEETLHRIVRRVAGRRGAAGPGVLKRFGEADPGWLSFPLPGWSLALEFPAALPGLAGLLDTLDEEVAAVGGRVCLAADGRLRPDLLAAMYPRLGDFRSLRAELDPRGVFVSDLARRLGL
ncbi:FAD-binding protein [Streptomyces sp. NPDC127190]|uniref:FAD-dependent oxidoreductase n=1 Tax=unclassified Streptomyces TaxID=2593676 RepID=UPI00362D6CD2